MPKIFEVVDTEGRKRLINSAWIQEVWGDGETTTIYFAFSVPYANVQDYICVPLPYDKVKQMLLEG